MTASYDARSIEARWSRRWDRDAVYLAPDVPTGPKFYNYDSGPFPNGPLHLGHVRTYVLGDVTARYQRALGKSVLYCTEWDAFGLPNELAALRISGSPREETFRWIRTMERQLRNLGISYDWTRVRNTSDPDYYKWTQWVFLRLLQYGLVVRKETTQPYCPDCQTTLARMQVSDGRCWRCDTVVEERNVEQWIVRLSASTSDLLNGMDRLDGWSTRVRNRVRGLCHSGSGRLDDDWVVSRQRAWGTPIPMIECAVCGFVPVPVDKLPVRLPEDLDWTLGSSALADHADFSHTTCPTCHAPALRETDTLDCFFDDIWCQISPLVDLEAEPGFHTDGVNAWFPVDQFHSGLDTATYLHLHRFFATEFCKQGELGVSEPIVRHVGHEMILSGGRKMSNHLHNGVSPSGLMRRHGADAIRVSVLRAARPAAAIEWRAEHVREAGRFLDAVYRFFVETAAVRRTGCDSEHGVPTKAASNLLRRGGKSAETVARFIDEDRPNAAIDAWYTWFRGCRTFAVPRIESARLSAADEICLRRVLDALLVTLSPFAPHLAEELWHRSGRGGYVVRQPWPRPSDDEPQL